MYIILLNVGFNIEFNSIVIIKIINSNQHVSAIMPIGMRTNFVYIL